MSNSSLVLTDVSKIYPGGIVALTDAFLELQNGIFGLLGPNGAGKTTLLRLIATLLKPTSGSVEFNGLDSQKKRALYRKNLGYLPQRFGLYPNLSAYEHILYFASLRGIKGRSAGRQARELLEEVGLSDVSDQKCGSFSGGMKQRVGIAGALIGSPPLLLVDEPTAGLDPEERVRFRTLLEKASRNAVVVLSTHIVQDVELGCTGVAVVAGGKILADCSPESLALSAKGKTWGLRAEPELLDELKHTHSITSVKSQENGLVDIRFVGFAPHVGEHEVEPSLEDGYLHLLSQGTWGE